ncbi:Ku protein [Streptomyces sp. WELS2]|uniref:Ku protein n=1 Tax=Streptomyces sp. WELS2 TaxID=2749435 RepID=UPI00215D947D|nr:Ku protein [Streptomyces sp. WELS2]
MRIAWGLHLQPVGQVGAKPYKLLVKALSRSAKGAVAKYTWSGRGRLSLLRVRDDVRVLHAMHWPDEIRDPTELLPWPTEVCEEETAGALALMAAAQGIVPDRPEEPSARLRSEGNRGHRGGCCRRRSGRRRPRRTTAACGRRR